MPRRNEDKRYHAEWVASENKRREEERERQRTSRLSRIVRERTCDASDEIRYDFLVDRDAFPPDSFIVARLALIVAPAADRYDHAPKGMVRTLIDALDRGFVACNRLCLTFPERGALDVDVCRLLGSTLSQNRLAHLKLIACGIESLAQVDALCNGLVGCSSLEGLDLSHNALGGEEGHQKLLETFRSNPKLPVFFKRDRPPSSSEGGGRKAYEELERWLRSDALLLSRLE